MAFYGSCDPEYGSWGRVPQWLLRWYVTMLPRLEAERDLAALQVAHAAADRPMGDRSYQRYTRQLRERANPEASRRKGVGGLKALAAFGIPVKFVGKKKEG